MAIITGSWTNDTLRGTAGDDTFDSRGGSDEIFGGTGTDTVAIFGKRSDFNIVTLSGVSRLYGLGTAPSEFRSTVSSLSAVEFVQFVDATAAIPFSANNLVFGSWTTDTLRGTAGDDTFDSRGGSDEIFGGAGTDTVAIFGKRSDFNIVTLSGVSRLYGLDTAPSEFRSTVSSLSAVEFVQFVDATASIPFSANNLVFGSWTTDTLRGTAGDDTFDSRGGSDEIFGGTGTDTVAIFGKRSDFNIVTLSGVSRLYGLGTAPSEFRSTVSSLSAVEFVQFVDATAAIPFSANNLVFGSWTTDTLRGTAGDDTFDSRGGSDEIFGGAGTDTVAIFGKRSDFNIVTLSGVSRLYGLDTAPSEFRSTVSSLSAVEFVQFVDATASIPFSANNLVFGSWTTDTLRGTAGDDTFDSRGGSDEIFGGAGTDTVAIFGKRSDFNIVTLSGVTRLTGLETAPSAYRNFTATLTDIERIQFSDEADPVDELKPIAAVAEAFRHPLGTGFLSEGRNDGDGYYVALDHAEFNAPWGYHIAEDWNGDGGGDSDLGDSVYAAAAGTVTYAGQLASTWGNVVIIQHVLADTSIVSTLYAHLDSIAVGLGPVTAGQQIGTLGKSGTALAHLHFAAYRGELLSTPVPPGYTSSPDPDPYSGWVDPSWLINSWGDPGNTLRSAAPLVTLNTQVQGRVGYEWQVSGQTQRDEYDYFSFVAQSTGALRIALRDLAADIDLRILDGSGSLIASSLRPGTADEEVSHQVTAGTQYHIQVSPYASAASPYTLSLAPAGNSGPLVSIVANRPSVLEGDSGNVPFRFDVSLAQPSDVPVTVRWKLEFNQSPAASLSDFVVGTPASGSVLFLPGETKTSITLEVAGDSDVESAGVGERFSVQLTEAQGGAVLDPLGRLAAGVIRDDDYRFNTEARSGPWSELALLSKAVYSVDPTDDSAASALVDAFKAGWTPITTEQLDALKTASDREEGLRPTGIFRAGASSALIVERDDTAVIAFTGTDEPADWLANVTGMYAAWDELAPLVREFDSYVQSKASIKKVLVTGHSLGGALAQMYMAQHMQDTKYQAVTFAAPGFNDGAITELRGAVASILKSSVSEQVPNVTGTFRDNRVLHFEMNHDVVPDLLTKSGRTVIVYGDGLGPGPALPAQVTAGFAAFSLLAPFAAPLSAAILASTVAVVPELLKFHSMDLYLKAVREVEQAFPAATIDQVAGWHVLLGAEKSADTYVVASRDDTLSDTRAGEGYDLIVGGPGQDRLSGSRSNDRLSGGEGTDTAVFASLRSGALLNRVGEAWSVSTPAGGTDVLYGIERLAFADVSVAVDVSGNAGKVARILGAVFGRESVDNEAYAGIGLYLLDGGTSYLDLVQLAIESRLGSGASTGSVVDLLYSNVVGTLPGPQDRAYFVGLLDSQVFTVASLGALAADTELNAVNIDLVGLARRGLEFEPWLG